MDDTLRYLSFSSSGSHGFVFEGVLQALEERDESWLRSVRGIAGTSGGALIALIVALGIPSEKRHSVLARLSDLTSFIQPSLSALYQNYGLEEGDAFRGVVQEILTLGGLSPCSTMRDLRRLLRIDIVFVAHCLNNGLAHPLTADSVPDMWVCDAVFASCCIPFVFTPVRHGELVLCDGALSMFIPDVFDREATLHVMLEPTYSLPRIEGWFDFMRSLLVSYVIPQRPFLDALWSRPRTIRIDHPLLHGLSVLESYDEETLDRLIDIGYVAAACATTPQIAKGAGVLALQFAHLNHASLTFPSARSASHPTPEGETADVPDS